MLKLITMIKRHGKPFVLFFSAWFILTGCAPTRQFGFPSDTRSPTLEDNKTVSIQDLDFHLNSSMRIKNTKEETSSMLKDRFMVCLANKNLSPVTEGDADYRLRGMFLISEKDSVNGWIVPGILVGVGLFPIGLFLMLAFPAGDYDYKTTADFTLMHTRSNREIISRIIEDKNHFSLNGYQTKIIKPNSKLNRTFRKVVDKTFSQTADEISAAIVNDTATYRDITDTSVVPASASMSETSPRKQEASGQEPLDQETPAQEIL